MRVLVVEDEHKMADLLKRGLEREGYAVDIAGSGDQAVWAGTEVPYDAVVLDAMIPARISTVTLGVRDLSRQRDFCAIFQGIEAIGRCKIRKVASNLWPSPQTY